MVSKRKQTIIEKVRLEKFVHGGQALAVDETGKKLLVWGGLPGELVDVRIYKKKRSYTEGIVVDVHEPSSDRVEPDEPNNYLSTSPWQIISIDAEQQYKDAILRETFEREGITDIAWGSFVAVAAPASGRAAQARIHSEPGATGVPMKQVSWGKVRNPEGVSHYRNKMEYGFWGDDEGLHFAHFVRGTHGKQIIQSRNSLAMERIATTSELVLKELRANNVWAGDLKTLIVRASQEKTAAALFVKNQDIDLKSFEALPDLHMKVYFSDPRSPASVPTKLLYSFGDTTLTDTVKGIEISYDVLSFFQVNLTIFERALDDIAGAVDGQSTVDFYSGVGTIGIAVGARILVESDEANITMARRNVGTREIDVVHAPSEKALDYITSDHILIVDPPRAGLHADVIKQILNIRPPKVIYLSCNPVTQARDVKLLQETYNISSARGYNFFPRTPHIESLIVLELKR